MGRTVETMSGAAVVAYRELGHGAYCEPCGFGAIVTEYDAKCDECGGEMTLDYSGDLERDEYAGIVDWVRDELARRFPSVTACDDWAAWPYRETRIIAANEFAQFTIAEYCGLIAISVIPTGSDYWADNTEGLARHWVESYAGPFVSETFCTLYHVSTFSNGEAIYTRRAA